MLKEERFYASIIAGAIGDAWGSSYENQQPPADPKTFYWGGRKEPVREWSLTDDTQLTLASCEALLDSRPFSPEILSTYFVKYYQQNRLNGVGLCTGSMRK